MSAYISFQIQKQHYGKHKMKWLTYEITMDKENKVWIIDNNGEGGEFDCEKLFDCIDKFFKDNY